MRWKLAFAVILIISVVIAWNIPAGRFSETLPVIVTVAEPGQIGVHTTREPQKMFDFGTTFPGTKVQKTMNLTRSNEPPALIHINASGAVQDWITIGRNDFVLDEPAQVDIFIIIPENAGKGAYSGNITIDYTGTYGMRTIQYLRQDKK